MGERLGQCICVTGCLEHLSLLELRQQVIRASPDQKRPRLEPDKPRACVSQAIYPWEIATGRGALGIRAPEITTELG